MNEQSTLTRRSVLGMAAATVAVPSMLAQPQPARAMTPITFRNWQSWTFRGIPATRFGLGGNSLSIEAQQSSSVVYGVVPRVAREATSASWQWRVTQGVGPTNLAARGGDDRSIALYFVFVDAGTADRFGDQTPSMARLMGMRGGRTLIYVWGGSSARGSILDSPYLGSRGKTLVLRAAGPGGWTNETVDLAGDHMRAFGRSKDTLIAVGVSSDADDTNAVNLATLRNLNLT